jgi:hypothetical protein
MAARTPSNVYQENCGSLNFIRAVFPEIDIGDTWASGLDAIWGFNVIRTDADLGSASISASLSSGTFTFNGSNSNLNAELYVWVKQ